MAKKLKVAVIGNGMIAHGAHLKGYASIPELCEMMIACDIIEERAKKTAAEFGIPRWTTDYKDVLADKEIDAVSVAVPNVSHHQITIDCLKAGKNVLCEKPLAMNGKQAREMCKVARESKKMLMVGLQTRFGGPASFVKDFIDNGGMGDIYYARAQALRRRGVPTWGVFTDKAKQGGGPLIDIGVHVLDLTLHLMGYPKPVSAFGKTWNTLGKTPGLYNDWGDYDRSTYTVEDFAVGLIKFENGAAVTLESSFMANMEGDPFQTQLFGTKAGAIVKAWGDKPVEIFTEQNKQMFTMVPSNVPEVESSHVREVQEFVKAVLAGGPSPVPGENGMILNAIFDALYKSSETGKEVKVDTAF